jgi:hypothetical protein
MSNVNPQRNSNCIVQPSQFNGGNLAQSFNLQNMRTIKAYASLIPYGQTNKSLFFTSYSPITSNINNPVTLATGDCFISAFVETLGNPIEASPLTTVQIYFALEPIFDGENNIWQPNPNSPTNPNTIFQRFYITDNITISQLNSGYNIPCIPGGTKVYGNISPIFYANWLTAVITNSHLITTPDPVIKITILVLNPINP